MARIRIWNPLPHAGRARHSAGGSRDGENPAHEGGVFMAHRYIVHSGHSHHRHHNPLGISEGNITFAAWGVAGGVGARVLPAVVMAAQNTGWMGYLLSGASAVALGFFGRMVS